MSMSEFVFLKGIIKTNRGISSLYSHIQHTYIHFILGFVFAGFHAHSVSLSAILGESHVGRKTMT